METEGLEMGKRPSRQRRHLPTSVTSAVEIKREKDTERSKNIPLLSMTFKDPSHHLVDEGEDATSFLATGSNHSNNKLLLSQRRKKKVVVDSKEIKRKTQAFIAAGEKDDSSFGFFTRQRKKQIVYTISFLWVTFMIYRIMFSFKLDDFSNISILHFLSKRMNR